MGIFDWLFDNTSLGQNGEENGVDVTYTGGTLKHLDDSDITYDAKIESDSSGNVHYYSSSDGFRSHSHDIQDSSGDFIYNRDADTDIDNHPWEDRNHILHILQKLSVEELREIQQTLIEFQQINSQKRYNK